jgi:hypothetical protein
MPDRDAAAMRDLIYCHYAKIIAKSAFAASDGESSGAQGLYSFCSLKHRGDKKSYDSIPPIHNCSGTLDTGDPVKPRFFVGGETMETKNVKDVSHGHQGYAIGTSSLSPIVLWVDFPEGMPITTRNGHLCRSSADFRHEKACCRV